MLMTVVSASKAMALRENSEGMKFSPVMEADAPVGVSELCFVRKFFFFFFEVSFCSVFSLSLSLSVPCSLCLCLSPPPSLFPQKQKNNSSQSRTHRTHGA